MVLACRGLLSTPRHFLCFCPFPNWFSPRSFLNQIPMGESVRLASSCFQSHPDHRSLASRWIARPLGQVPTALPRAQGGGGGSVHTAQATVLSVSLQRGRDPLHQFSPLADCSLTLDCFFTFCFKIHVLKKY